MISGIRVEKASDDPVATPGIMQSTQGLRALEQYRRNLSSARTRLDVEDSVLQQITDVMVRIKELSVGQMTGTATPQTRSITKAEVDQMREFTRALSNTQVGGIFLFGGVYSDRQPFPPAGPDPLRLPTGQHRVEVGVGQTVDTNHDGMAIFVDSGMTAALASLSTALGADDVPGIGAAVTQLDAAFAKIQELVGELGARMNHADLASANVDTLEINLQTLRSNLQDASLEEAITKMVSRQSTLEAALLTNAQIANTTLTDFLR